MQNQSDGIGIASGQLYYLIKQIKTSADTASENDLKDILFSHLFGNGAYIIAQHPSTMKEYYCAHLEDWVEVLGETPEISVT